MKTIWTLTLAASALAFAGEELVLKTTVGDTVERTFHHESDLSLEGMSMTMDGEEGPQPPGGMEQEIFTETNLTIRDVVLEVEDGRALSLERSFSGLTNERTMHMTDPMGGVHDQDTVEESELEGKTVVLELEGDETSAQWAEGSSGEADLLEDLVMSLDLDILLPEGEVAEGDTWEVPASLLATLSRPSGELHLEPTEKAEDKFGAPPEGFEPPQPEYDGDITATFLGLQEQEGRQLGAIELAIDVFALVDLSEIADFDMGGPEDAPPDAIMPEIDSMEEELQYSGEGLALWDIEDGRLHSLEISCDVRKTQTITLILMMGDEEKTMEQVSVLSGTESWEVQFDE